MLSCRHKKVLPLRSVHCCFFLLLIFFLPAGCATKVDISESPAATTGYVLHDNGDGTCVDVQTGKVWQIKRDGRFSSLADAVDHTDQLVLAGYDDWRLPSTDEILHLQQIFLWKKNGDCSMNLQGDFWSISSSEKGVPGHWETYYLCGPEFKYTESRKMDGYLRAVRP